MLTINDVPEGDYGPEVQFEIQEQRLRDYQEAVNFLRFNGFDVVCLHEFGIYGGRSGAISWHPPPGRPPVVTTCIPSWRSPVPTSAG